MRAALIDGKAIAAEIRKELKTRCEALVSKGVQPGLAVVLVGEDPASEIYVRNKEKACQKVGIASTVFRLPKETTEEALIERIQALNADPSIHGILLQLPLPQGMEEHKILQLIDPSKDVDGFHVYNMGALVTGNQGFLPCTPKGCMRLLEKTGIEIAGKDAVVVGRSNIVGKPMALLLLQKNATVTLCHSKTKNIGEHLRRADIVVAAVGKPEMITGDMIKPGAVVLDVGVNRVDGRVVGDVAFDSVAEVAGYLTPVPGGVGPMTIAMLIENTLEAAERSV